jgi:hypothetical protein
MLVRAGEHVKYRRFVCNELHLIPLSWMAFLWDWLTDVCMVYAIPVWQLNIKVRINQCENVSILQHSYLAFRLRKFFLRSTGITTYISIDLLQ